MSLLFVWLVGLLLRIGWRVRFWPEFCAGVALACLFLFGQTHDTGTATRYLASGIFLGVVRMAITARRKRAAPP